MPGCLETWMMMNQTFTPGKWLEITKHQHTSSKNNGCVVRGSRFAGISRCFAYSPCSKCSFSLISASSPDQGRHPGHHSMISQWLYSSNSLVIQLMHWSFTSNFQRNENWEKWPMGFQGSTFQCSEGLDQRTAPVANSKSKADLQGPWMKKTAVSATWGSWKKNPRSRIFFHWVILVVSWWDDDNLK